ncbi:MAG: hypothetical protein RBS57_04040 [Desulforhabdus sp.]|jgi:hypothetical protein|nr:hypothetical protein [Desulforhabdus sp.]
MAGKRVVLFGASKMGKRTLESWSPHLGPVLYFVDNDPDKWGGKLNELPIYAPDVLVKEDLNDLLIIVTSTYYDQIATQLEAMGMVEGLHFATLEQALSSLVMNEPGSNLPKVRDRTDHRAVVLLMIPVGWFGLDYIRLKRECDDAGIQCFFVSPPRRSNQRVTLALTPQNFKQFRFNGVPLFAACRYNICVSLKLSIDKLDSNNEHHWASIIENMEQTAAYIRLADEVLQTANPDIVLIPQGYTMESAVYRFLCVLQGLRLIAIENSLNANRLIWDDQAGIAVNKIPARNYFWRWEELTDLKKAMEYVNWYLSSIKKLKQAQHQSPEGAPNIENSKRPTILYLANVLTDASVMFNSRVGSQLEAIKATARTAISHGYNFILKIHPRERPGHSQVYQNLTLSALKQDDDFWQVISNSKDCYIDDSNKFDTYALIQASDVCVTVCSQAGLEALLLGKETVLLGDAYYGGLGFTHDISHLSQLDQGISDALNPLRKRIDKVTIAHFFYIFDCLFSIEKSEHGVVELLLRTLGRRRHPLPTSNGQLGA